MNPFGVARDLAIGALAAALGAAAGALGSKAVERSLELINEKREAAKPKIIRP